MDKVSKETRSNIMRKVRSTNNKSTEWKFRVGMMREGLKGWKVQPKIEFSPDFSFEHEKVVIFIDGCFWHGCPVCKKTPSSNIEYWEKKFQKNNNRDKEAEKKLSERGWIVLRFWEHEVKDNLDGCLTKLKQILQDAVPRIEPLEEVKCSS